MKAKLTIFTIAVLSTFSLAQAQNEKVSKKEAPSVKAFNRAPELHLSSAVLKLQQFCDKQYGKNMVYIDEAAYVREEQEAYWKIGIRKVKEETGHMFYKVFSDGRIEQSSVVKDG